MNDKLHKTELEFHATQFENDDVALRIGFANGENKKHYFIMQLTKSS
jgi:hypothetical protein